MAVEMQDLIARLEREVPEFGDIPDSTGYRNCITSAVVDFSGKLPFQRYTTFDMVSGTASYELPADFASIVYLQTWDDQDGLLNTPEGLIPVAPSYTERYFIEGTDLVFVPTPAYSWSGRGLRYIAQHVLTGTPTPDTYALMTARDVEIFMPMAVALALGLQANYQARNAVGHRTQAGAESSNEIVTELRARIRDNERLYKERVADAKRKGVTIRQATYTRTEQDLMLAQVT